MDTRSVLGTPATVYQSTVTITTTNQHLLVRTLYAAVTKSGPCILVLVEVPRYCQAQYPGQSILVPIIAQRPFQYFKSLMIFHILSILCMPSLLSPTSYRLLYQNKYVLHGTHSSPHNAMVNRPDNHSALAAIVRRVDKWSTDKVCAVVCVQPHLYPNHRIVI